MNVQDFDFALPDELVSQYPAAERGFSRLLVLPRYEGSCVHTTFDCLPDHLRPGDLLVLNDTRVFPARLLGRRVPSGGEVECLLLRQRPTPNSQFPSNSQPQTPDSQQQIRESDRLGVGTLGVGSLAGEVWEALMHPGQKLKPGAQVVFERDDHRLYGEVVGRHFHGRRTIRLSTGTSASVAEAIERIGHIPLPPYIHRPDDALDRERYQTVYARVPGSVAAPTSGLHFSRRLMDSLEARGVELAYVTLHVGYGTFKPVRVDRVEDHEVDPETYAVSAVAADALTRARREGRRIIAVGTTTTRALESLTVEADRVAPGTGSTSLFIRPGHQFRILQGLVTNFHLPCSSLLMLVAAFTGRERILAAYREAVERGYRFYSYGDGMLIL